MPSLHLFDESNSMENYEKSRSESVPKKSLRNVPRKAKSEALHEILLKQHDEISNDSIDANGDIAEPDLFNSIGLSYTFIPF